MRLSASNYRLVPVYNVLQDQHRFICGDPCDESLRVYDTAYPPFQLIMDDDLGIPSSVRLKKVCGDGNYNTNWANSVTRIEKDIDQDEVNEWVYTFSGGAFIGVPSGTYYIEITFPGSVLMYTETFYHPGECINCKEYWYLEYSNSCDEKSLGDYSGTFVNKLWLGDITLIRDGELKSVIERKDGFGVVTNIAADIRPKWAFELFGNSWLFDSLSFLDRYDQIYLKRSGNADVFDLKNIDVTSRGDITQDCNFPIKITFTKDVLVNTKCCDSVYEQAPVPANCAGMHVMTSENFQICLGDSVDLVATVVGGSLPYVYIWSNGEIGDTITVSPTETTTFIITVIDAFGCVKQDEVTITVITCTGEFTVEITADPSPSCPGESVDLDATVTGGIGPFTYSWSTGATTQDITVNPEATTVYSLLVTDTGDGGATVMQNITVIVNNAPVFSINSNGLCFLQLGLSPACEVVTYQWQVEGPPSTWSAAPGTNNGTTYNGISGSNYRLKMICDGCTGYSNEVTVTCVIPCTTDITSVVYDSEAGELNVTILTALGSAPFITGYLAVYESLAPAIGDCASSGSWSTVITVTLTSESYTIVIPYTPAFLPGCLLLSLNINAGECTHDEVFPIS